MTENIITISGLNISEIINQIADLKKLIISILDNNLPKYIPVETAEKKFLITGQTLNKLVKEGKLNKYKLSDRTICYKTEELYALIESNQVKTFKPKNKKSK